MFHERLVAAGMSTDAAASKQRLFDRALAALGGAADVTLFVPGRIEVLGKHTDYAGGRSLLCAVERGMCLVARARQDGIVRAVDVVSSTTVESELASGTDSAPLRLDPDWGVYISTVARRLALNFVSARRGADIFFGSDLPPAAGMSSSSALVTSVALVLSAINNLQNDEAYRRDIKTPEDLAEYLGTIENGQDFRGLKGESGVGTFGGSEDHTAMLCCHAGELSLYRFCPVVHERQIRLPRGYCFVVGGSGVVAVKTGGAKELYNRASLKARRALEIWNSVSSRSDRSLAAAVESSEEAAQIIRRVLGWEEARQQEHGVLRRFEQFYQESFVIIPKVVERLEKGDIESIGDLVEQSQRGAELGLVNQVPETVFLADSARLLGAHAASAFGAGFGGSVWALLDRDRASDFAGRWRSSYLEQFRQHANRCDFFISGAGPAAMRLS